MDTAQGIIDKVGGRAFDKAVQAMKYVLHCETNLQKLKDEMRNLQDRSQIIEEKVREATRLEEEVYGAVLHWRTDMEKMTDDVKELERQSNAMVNMSCSVCTCPNIKQRYRLSKVAEEKIAGVQKLTQDSHFDEISHTKQLPPELEFSNIKAKLQKEMGTVQYYSAAIGNRVRDAIDRGEEVNEAVMNWCTEADKMIRDVQEFLGQSSGTDAYRMTRGVGEIMEQSSGTDADEMTCDDPKLVELSKQAEKMIAGFQVLTREYGNFGEISYAKPPPRELEFPSDENYVNFASRTQVFTDIMDALKDSSVNIIGVHGPGGVGKTSLAEEISKKMQQGGTFKQVTLAVVSKDFNVKDVQSKLADGLNFKLDVTLDEKGRATQLWHRFKNGEEYLVILDDIWKKVDLKTIGIPITDGKTGCKVLLTSRNEDLLSREMKVHKSFSIAILSEPEAWTLFKKLTGNSINESLAFKVCKKCKGLPLAINALGAALTGKPEHAWRTALAKLDSYMLGEIDGIDQSIWASLKVSYDMLSSSDARSCFLLCCLFPEDAEIPIDNLTRHCVARRLLVPKPRKLDEARDAVLTAVDSLKSANLLSHGIDEYGIKENFVRIHDVIRDIGISIAREEEAYLVDRGALPTDASSYSAISITFNDMKALPSGLVYPQLHTLMLYGVSQFSNVEIPDNFFDGMPQLTVLTFIKMRMRRLPSSLAKLANLRMLHLIDCNLEDIAILKDLKSNLEVLSLEGSSIEALPDIGQSTSLRVLDLRCFVLNAIPQGVISNLSSTLEELYFPRYSPHELCFSILEELKRSLSMGQLTTLNICIEDFMRLSNEALKFENLKRFYISTTSESDYLILPQEGTRVLYLGDVPRECSCLRNDLIPLVDKAEILVIEDFEGLKKVLHDRGVGNEFPNLKCLQVKSCDEMMHPSHVFNNLTVLSVVNCKLKYLFSPTTAKGLAHLERLSVANCKIMEGIVGFEGQNHELIGEMRFSRLKQLELCDLPNLICFYAKKEKQQSTMEGSLAHSQPFFNEQAIFPVLESLTIESMDNIIEIWDMQSITVLDKEASFCQLRNVNVQDCKKLMYLFPSKMHPLLANIEELEIADCETMEAIVRFDDEGLSDRACFSKLRSLEVCGAENIVQPLFNEKVSFPALEKFVILRVPRIKSIWDMQPLSEQEKDAESWCKLLELKIQECDELVYAFPSNVLPRLRNLQTLWIGMCKAMEGLISSNLEEKEATNNDLIVFHQLKALDLGDLPNLKSLFGPSDMQPFSSDKVSFPALEQFVIVRMPKIKSIWDMQPLSEQEKDAESWCNLLVLGIQECDELVYAFPSYVLPRLRNLQTLRIGMCKAMEGLISSNLEEKEATNNDLIVFHQLKALVLWDLPNLKSLFGPSEMQLFSSDKVSFPALEKFVILRVPRIKSIWDMQPLSEQEKDAESWCKLLVLGIHECDGLVYAFPSYVLPRLRNLETLWITKCNEMEGLISSNLEEKEATNNDLILFHQLKALDLGDLPNLKSLFGPSDMQLFSSDKVSFPALEKFVILRVPRIKSIWDMQPLSEQEKDVESWCKLLELKIQECDELVYAFPSYVLPRLRNLQTLWIGMCKAMEGLIASNLEEKEATNNDLIVFHQLKALDLGDLPNLKSLFGPSDMQLFSSDKVSFPALEQFVIVRMPKIKNIWDMHPLSEQQKDVESWCKLLELKIRECDELVYAFPSYVLPRLRNLQSLRIRMCKAMAGMISSNLEEKEATNSDLIVFHQLKALELWDLPNLKSLFGPSEMQLFSSDKVSFPALEQFVIVRMPKIKNIWDMHPLSEQQKDAESWCNLLVLGIHECDGLVYTFPSYVLPRLRNLQSLLIGRCKAMAGMISSNLEEKEATNSDLIVFHQLKALELWDLPNLKSLFGPSEMQLFSSDKVSFPALEKFVILLVPKIKSIWDMQPLSEQEKDVESWCKLLELKIRECDELVYAFPSYVLPRLRNLQTLWITKCNKMEGLISSNLEEKEATNNDLIVFHQLKALDLGDLPNLKSLFGPSDMQLFLSDKVSFPALEKFVILRVPRIKSIWDMQPLSEQEKDVESWCKLLELKIQECDELVYAFPSYVLPRLRNLQTLWIGMCKAMEGLIASNLEEKEATNNDLIVFHQLKALDLGDLPNLKSLFGPSDMQLFSSDKVSFPALEQFVIVRMPKIKNIWDMHPLSEQQKDVESWCKLLELKIRECDELVYAFPSYVLPRLRNLQSLRIRMCKAMAGMISSNLEEKEATNSDLIVFHQLKALELWDLPNLKSLFGPSEMQLFSSDKVSFPALEKFVILRVPKIKSIWDMQPLSEQEKDVESWCKLLELKIQECDELVYAFPSYVLPRLRNLQTLWIGMCKAMKGLISSNLEEKEATNNDLIVFHQLKALDLGDLPNLKSLFGPSDMQLFSSDKNLQRLRITDCKEMEGMISGKLKEKEATNNDPIVFHQLKALELEDLPNLKSLYDPSETQLFFSDKDAFPVLEKVGLVEKLEFLLNGTSTQKRHPWRNVVQVARNVTVARNVMVKDSMKFYERTPTTEECGASSKENDHDGEEG